MVRIVRRQFIAIEIYPLLKAVFRNLGFRYFWCENQIISVDLRVTIETSTYVVYFHI